MALRKFTSTEVGNNIRRIRVDLGRTQEEFGKEVGGYSQDTVAKWESGQVPHALVLIKIARLSRCTVDSLLGVEGVRRQREEKEILADIRRDLAELQKIAEKRGDAGKSK